MEDIVSKTDMDATTFGYIYKITNMENGKIYIGQHKSQRIDENYWGSGKLICKAIKKYGTSSFSREVLEWCTSLEQLNEREIYWIAEYNSCNSEIGYNISRGGNCPNIEHFSLEHRKKISESNKGKHSHSFDTRKKISESNKGKHSNISDETRKKISDANKGRTRSDETRHKLSIAKRGKKLNLTDEQRKAMSDRVSGENNPNYGKPRDEETRMKISMSNKGRPGSRTGMHNSPEHTQRLREANIGRKVSDETRALMRDRAAKRVYLLLCQDCGSTFQAKGPRTKFCQTCGEYRAKQ